MGLLLFWLPLGISLLACGYFTLLTDSSPLLKAAVISIVGMAAVLQFAPIFAPHLQVHFLIPLVTQMAVSLVLLLHRQFEEATSF